MNPTPENQQEEAMTTHVEALREALKPFADMAKQKHIDPEWPDERRADTRVDTSKLTLADLRRAAEAYAALEASLSTEDGFVRGLEAAAGLIKKRRDDYHEEHAIYDYETGATEYPGNGLDFMSEWEELEEAIRALSPAPASPRVEAFTPSGADCHPESPHASKFVVRPASNGEA